MVVGCAVFGASLVLLYAASTLYHALRAPRVKGWLRVLDHGAIFLLIAGTYTPFLLVSLRGPWVAPAARVNDGSIKAIGVSLLTTYSMAFELISLVLLVAIVGALVIARTGRTKP